MMEDRNISIRMQDSLNAVLPSLAAVPPGVSSSSDVINLSAAENHLLKKELGEFFALNDNEKTYVLPSFGGQSDTRAALASFFNDFFHPSRSVLSDHVCITAGAGYALEALISTICEQGDTVIVASPYWSGFEPYLALRPRVEILSTGPSAYSSHVKDLPDALYSAYDTAPRQDRVKALILSNPHNPFSQSYPEATLLECMKFCQDRDLHFISDEVYALNTIGIQPSSTGSKFVSALTLGCSSNDAPFAGPIEPHRVHVIWSPSKLLGLNGLRIGCVISQSNEQVRRAVSLLSYMNVSALSATVMTNILSSPSLPKLLALNSRRLGNAYQKLSGHLSSKGIQFLPPDEGLFVFAKLGKEVLDVAQENEFFDKLHTDGILISPGRCYDKNSSEFGWARITLSVTPEDLDLGLERLSKSIK